MTLTKTDIKNAAAFTGETLKVTLYLLAVMAAYLVVGLILITLSNELDLITLITLSNGMHDLLATLGFHIAVLVMTGVVIFYIGYHLLVAIYLAGSFIWAGIKRALNIKS
jgi:hypothetical protein